ncbi:hypothetical protein THAOC_20992 [Thalassiosira oceanica]|uniref:Uncharacterized protein n=1 Tax=Thalassiosira oceanica TaxID=159749 RepID=K0S221_THAOC|nr:hypothetical protein THAOC_20992 [Thalassiosira oceanica]|eukprot:EJK58849.1 hypothetical protein THAOC_20992 [Thalassiosira oceanica]
MSLLDDDVGGGPCHIDRNPSGLVSSRPLAPQGRSVLSDSVSPISAIPPRGATQVESQRYNSFGYPPGRCPGLVQCYRGRHGRDAIRIEHHHGRTRGFRFSFSFLRRGRGSASVEPQDPAILHMVYSYSTTELSKPTVTYSLSETVSSRLGHGGKFSRLVGRFYDTLAAVCTTETWGVDDDGGTDAPTHLQVTPLRGTNTFSVDAILLSTRQIFGSHGDEDREPQIFSGMFWHRGSVLSQFFFL